MQEEEEEAPAANTHASHCISCGGLNGRTTSGTVVCFCSIVCGAFSCLCLLVPLSCTTFMVSLSPDTINSHFLPSICCPTTTTFPSPLTTQSPSFLHHILMSTFSHLLIVLLLCSYPPHPYMYTLPFPLYCG